MSSDDSTSSQYDWVVQQLLESPVTNSRSLTQSEKRSLDATYAIAELNFYELAKFVDGDLEESPYLETSCEISCDYSQSELFDAKPVRELQFRHYRHLHNYLASIYSYLEHIRTLVNRRMPNSVELKSTDFTSSDEQDGSHLTLQLTFVLGLRTACQHSDFRGLSFKPYTINAEENRVQVILEFNEHEFVDSNIRRASDFLSGTTGAITQYPISFLTRFHRNNFQYLDEDVRDWFENSE